MTRLNLHCGYYNWYCSIQLNYLFIRMWYNTQFGICSRYCVYNIFNLSSLMEGKQSVLYSIDTLDVYWNGTLCRGHGCVRRRSISCIWQKKTRFGQFSISSFCVFNCVAIINAVDFGSPFAFNPLWPNDAIWRQGSRSTLVQLMACCLTAPRHYLNQCWLIIIKVLWC